MDFQSDLEKYYADEEKKDVAPKYSTSDTVFALIAFIVGFLFINWVLLVPESIGVGGTLLVIAFSVMSGIYLRLKGRGLTLGSLFGLIGIDVLSLSYFIFANDFIKFLVTVFIIFGFAYWFYVAFDNRKAETVDDMLPAEIFGSAVILPFSSFGKIFGATGNGIKSTSVGKKIGMILLGILVAVIPTAIVTTLLLNADDAFVNLTDDLFSDVFRDLPKNIWHFILGVPVAMYVFGMMFSNSEHLAEKYISRERSEKAAEKARIAPAMLVCAAITPIIIVYLLFFFSQTGYFLSAFSGIRPEGITYAEYARKGFFELCSVSVINLVIIIVTGLFVKRENGKASGAVRGYLITLSAFTLVLIAIAVSKMVMYIDAYGLTRLRVYTTWFMVALFVLFVFIIIRQITPKFNLLGIFAWVAIVMFAVLVFADADALIAKYNVHWYQTGKFKTVDIDTMYELSDSAVKYVVPLADDDNPMVAEEAQAYIRSKNRELSRRENKFANFNLTTHYASELVGVETGKE